MIFMIKHPTHASVYVLVIIFVVVILVTHLKRRKSCD
jgi:hypothetical protein